MAEHWFRHVWILSAVEQLGPLQLALQALVQHDWSVSHFARHCLRRSAASLLEKKY